jgi:hypothetical protein
MGRQPELLLWLEVSGAGAGGGLGGGGRGGRQIPSVTSEAPPLILKPLSTRWHSIVGPLAGSLCGTPHSMLLSEPRGTVPLPPARRPPSSLKRLLSAIRQAQADDPNQFVGLQRKPTGFVPASTPAALVRGPSRPAGSRLPGHAAGVGAAASRSPQHAALAAARRQRAAWCGREACRCNRRGRPDGG